MPHIHGGTDAPECTTCINIFLEDTLIRKIERIVGHVPIGTRDLLHVLTHPDVIKLTREYIEGKERNRP